MPGKVLIFSAPSGSGKTTLVRYALEHFPTLQFSVSCTTRPPRGTEKHGVDYYFLTPAEFRTKIDAGEFIEHEEVYHDKFYGTLRSEVERIWAAGGTVIFDVDVKGGIALKKYFGADALAVFIQAPSIQEIETRLTARATDDAEVIRERVAKAADEMLYAPQFDAIIINDRLGDAQRELVRLLTNFGLNSLPTALK